VIATTGAFSSSRSTAKYLKQVFVNRAGPAAAGVGSIAFSPDKDQRFMLLADFGNSKIAVLDQESGRPLSVRARGPNPGEFQGCT
jgi:hypothetical protein